MKDAHTIPEALLMDTKYFQQALDEMTVPWNMVGSLTCRQLSDVLRRAQELKDADFRFRPDPGRRDLVRRLFETLLMDTKYFQQALDEMTVPWNMVGSLTCRQLSDVLRRAQELKDADAAARAEERGIA